MGLDKVPHFTSSLLFFILLLLHADTTKTADSHTSKDSDNNNDKHTDTLVCSKRFAPKLFSIAIHCTINPILHLKSGSCAVLLGQCRDEHSCSPISQINSVFFVYGCGGVILNYSFRRVGK